MWINNIPGTKVPDISKISRTTANTTNVPSILIAIPAMDMVYTQFASSLALCMANLVNNGINTNCVFNISTLVSIARTNLVNIFLKSQYEYICWIDSDMKFPIDAPIKLLARNKEIVGVNYRQRKFPNPRFTACKKTNDIYHEIKTTNTSPELELCDVLPHGLTLVKREVYTNIQEPHYIQQYLPEKNIEVGEDVYFCEKAKAAGYDIWCDHFLSKQVSHIGTFNFTYNLDS